MLDKIKEHFSDYALLYLASVFLSIILFGFIKGQEFNRAEHGKIEVIGNCEFIKLYTGGSGSDSKFQYIHNPKCQNH